MRRQVYSRAERDARRRRVTPRKMVPQMGRSLAAHMLWMVAPQIEAAGSVQRAVECELMGGFGDGEQLLEMLNALVPIERGGHYPGPLAAWLEMVEEIVAERHVDMDGLRRLCEGR